MAVAARCETRRDACTLAPGPTRTVVSVIDGETLGLDDGSEARLIGALAPRAFDVGAAAGQWPPEIAAVEYLRKLALGRSVRLAFGGRRADRYGRHLAHVFVIDRGEREWVQGAMLEAGISRSYGLPESFACARELDAHEHDARRERRGLWSNYLYRAQRADRPGALMRLRFRYARVEGVVHSVLATRTAVFVNFGANWRQDFTARAGSAVTKLHADFKARLEAFKGRRVVVRGWIERNNGPMIELYDPSQIALSAGEEPAPLKAEPEHSFAPSSADRSPNSDAPKQDRPAPSTTEPGGVDL